MKRFAAPLLAVAAVLAYAACDRVVDLTPPDGAMFQHDAPIFVPDAEPDAGITDALNPDGILDALPADAATD